MFILPGGVGGGGGVDLDGGSLGAARGGKGGATGGVGATEGGGGGALKDGFLDEIGGGGGGFPRLDGRGGGALGGKTSMEDWVDRSWFSGFGLGGGFRGALRRFATNGFAG